MIDKRFVLYKKIARGGMAEIFLGKLMGEDGFERVCCFKRILPHFAVEKDFIEMFRDEAHIGKRLQHPNIVRVEGFEEVDGAYAIIMEFINGADLRSVVNSCESQQTKIPIPIAVHIIAEAARGLHYAHVKKDDVTNRPLGIVHRDISPQNILLSFEGEVKVTDFGIAEADTKNTETKTGIVKGKFSYMSPEQISAQPVDARTDVFALGIILWEMMTGKRLFYSENEVLIIQMVRDCMIPEDIKAYNPEINEELEKIISKALKKNLEERYESASAFEKDLRLYQSKYNPGLGAEELGGFLRDLMNDRRVTLANDIKELLSPKENPVKEAAFELDLRGPSKPTQGATQATSSAKSTDPTRLSKSRSGFPDKATRISSVGGAPKSPSSTGGGSPFHTPSDAVRKTQPQKHLMETSSLESNYARKYNSLLIFILVALGVGAGLYFYMSGRSKYDTVNWAVSTTPDIVKISLDGYPLFNNQFVKTPVEIKNLLPGPHTLLISRPGFGAETLSLTLSKDKVTEHSNFILKEVDKMAPLKLQLKFAGNPVKFSVDNGLIEGTLTYDKPLALSSITFGNSHIILISSSAGQFSCEFTPRAQSWENPFYVVVDPALKKCSYPASMQ